jgi:hypothetical protein
MLKRGSARSGAQMTSLTVTINGRVYGSREVRGRGTLRVPPGAGERARALTGR